jgi:hypothetical protein
LAASSRRPPSDYCFETPHDFCARAIQKQ